MANRPADCLDKSRKSRSADWELGDWKAQMPINARNADTHPPPGPFPVFFFAPFSVSVSEKDTLIACARVACVAVALALVAD
jgi:hypothetical protein